MDWISKIYILGASAAYLNKVALNMIQLCISIWGTAVKGLRQYKKRRHHYEAIMKTKNETQTDIEIFNHGWLINWFRTFLQIAKWTISKLIMPILKAICDSFVNNIIYFIIFLISNSITSTVSNNQWIWLITFLYFHFYT